MKTKYRRRLLGNLTLPFLILLTFFQSYVLADAPPSMNKPIDHSHPCISGGAKKTVLYIGSYDKSGSPVFNGTGFLAVYDDHTYIITAKHVVTGLKESCKDDEIAFFCNTKDGKGISIMQDWIQRRTNSNWILSETADVAMMPYVLTDNVDARTIPQDFFVPANDLVELEEAFYISYQPGLETAGRITPIVRSGAISIINEDNTFVLDAFVFPGNSGSPVFVKPSVLNDSVSASQSCKFIGLVSSYLPYRDVAVSAQTKQARIIFEENTGLATIVSAKAIQDLIKSDAFIKQHKIFKEQIKKFMK